MAQTDQHASLNPCSSLDFRTGTPCWVLLKKKKKEKKKKKRKEKRNQCSRYPIGFSYAYEAITICYGISLYTDFFPSRLKSCVSSWASIRTSGTSCFVKFHFESFGHFFYSFDDLLRLDDTQFWKKVLCQRETCFYTGPSIYILLRLR